MTTIVPYTKVIEIENEIPDINDLTTGAAMNTKAAGVESKIRDINNLATKTALDTKATEIGNKALIPHVLLLPLNLMD